MQCCSKCKRCGVQLPFSWFLEQSTKPCTGSAINERFYRGGNDPVLDPEITEEILAELKT